MHYRCFSNYYETPVQNNDLGDLGINYFGLNGTTCWRDPLMLQSAPEREKSFFLQSNNPVHFTWKQVHTQNFQPTWKQMEPIRSRINPAFGTWSCLWDEHISLWHASDKRLGLSRDVQTGSSRLSRACTTTAHRSRSSDSTDYYNYRAPWGVPWTQRCCSESPWASFVSLFR